MLNGTARLHMMGDHVTTKNAEMSGQVGSSPASYSYFALFSILMVLMIQDFYTQLHVYVEFPM